MTHLFYFTALIFLIYEIHFLLTLKSQYKKGIEFNKLSKENDDKKWDDMSDEYKTRIKNRLFLIPFLIWTFIGLFTSQWIGFLLFIVFQYVIIYPLNKLVGFSPIRLLTTGINTIVGILFPLFIIINHYHLHLDTYQIFMDLLSKIL